MVKIALSLGLIFTFALPLQTATSIAWASENIRIYVKDENPKTCTYCHRDFDKAQADISQCDTCGVGAHTKCAEALSFQCGNLGCGGAFGDNTENLEEDVALVSISEARRIQASVPKDLAEKEAILIMGVLGSKFRDFLLKASHKEILESQREKLVKNLDRILLTAQVVVDRLHIEGAWQTDTNPKVVGKVHIDLRNLVNAFKDVRTSRYWAVASLGSGLGAVLSFLVLMGKVNAPLDNAVLVPFFSMYIFVVLSAFTGGMAIDYSDSEKEKKTSQHRHARQFPALRLNRYLSGQKNALRAFFAPLCDGSLSGKFDDANVIETLAKGSLDLNCARELLGQFLSDDLEKTENSHLQGY